MAFATRPQWLLTLGTAIICAAGCGGDPPVSTPLPTVDRVVTNPQAFGVPYGTYVLIKDGDRLIALKITTASALGDHISYSWEEFEHTAGDRSGPVARRGQGETSEMQNLLTGRIAIPGLGLTWSRGSSRVGWVYWPGDDHDFAVFSRPWMQPAEIDPKSRSGKWLRKTGR